MKYRLIILALMMVGIACQAQNKTDNQGRKQGHWVKNDKQGNKIYEGDFVDDMETGLFTYYYPDGTVRITNEYSVPGKVCKHKVYNQRGQLLAEGNFNQKNRDGLWLFYDGARKQPVKLTTYKMGVRHGLQVIFTSNGDTAEVCNWADNHRHGRWWKRIGERGYITATYVRGGIEGRLVEYDDNGLLIREGYYKDGFRHGTCRYYDQGHLVVEEDWTMGRLRDRRLRLLLPEERFVSIFNINYMAPQGNKKTVVYLANGTKLVNLEGSDVLYGRIGNDRFTLANKEARIMVATDLIVGTTRDREGREILNLDPRPDFDVFPDEDCMKMLHSLKLQQQTVEDGGSFDFDR